MTDRTAPRVYSDRDQMVPRVLVRAMALLALTALVLVSLARLTDRPLDATPPASPVVAERLITIDSALSGAAEIRDQNGDLVAVLSAEDGGFVAGLHRVILRERANHRVAADGPILLQAHENGRLSIHDPSTGWGADLMGFGADNARAIARLLQ